MKKIIQGLNKREFSLGIMFGVLITSVFILVIISINTENIDIKQKLVQNNPIVVIRESAFEPTFFYKGKIPDDIKQK